MRFITVAVATIAAMVAAPYVAAADTQVSLESALALAAHGGSASSRTYTKEYTKQQSTEVVRTIETHIHVDITIVRTEKTTVEVKESWIARWNEQRKSQMDAEYLLYIKERDQAKANWFAARRRILEARITIAVHIRKWGGDIHSEFVSDMVSLHNDIVEFNHEIEVFIVYVGRQVGHGIGKALHFGEVVIGSLVFAGVEAVTFTVHTSEDAWRAISADAKSIWLSFGLHLELFWSMVKNAINTVRNDINTFETNTENKWNSAVNGWKHPNVGSPQCPPCDCSHAVSAKADSMEEDSSAPEHHRRQHKQNSGVRVEVDIN